MMNNSTQNGQKQQVQQTFLYVKKLEITELLFLQKQQTNILMASIAEIEQSKSTIDHIECISRLKVLQQKVRGILNSNLSEQQRNKYEKVLISISGHLIIRFLSVQNYKQSKSELDLLLPTLTTISPIRQLIYILFNIQSLYSICSYRIENNCEFKYPHETQQQFFYILGRVKQSFKKFEECVEVYDRIVARRRYGENFKHMAKVYEILIHNGQHHYQPELKQVKNSGCVGFFQGQRECQEYIISKLGQIQAQFMGRQVQPRLNKKMFEIYLQRIIQQEGKNNDIKNFQKSFSEERNPLVIREILTNCKAAKQAQYLFESVFDRMALLCLRGNFRLLFNLKPVSRVIEVKPQSKGSKRSVVSSTSSRGTRKKRTYIHSEKFLIRCLPKDASRAEQILMKCKYGSYLCKANLGNNSLVRKYARVEDKQFCWADSADDIEFSSSKCKWKHVLGIVYGKVSKNFRKPKFETLQPWKCFSLISSDRSYDFYCENEADIFFWLQAISYKLQTFHKNSSVCNYPYYNKGRALWKMMLLKMAFNYRDPIQKYKCDNAGSIISFAKSLNSKKTQKSVKN